MVSLCGFAIFFAHLKVRIKSYCILTTNTSRPNEVKSIVIKSHAVMGGDFESNVLSRKGHIPPWTYHSISYHFSSLSEKAS